MIPAVTVPKTVVLWITANPPSSTPLPMLLRLNAGNDGQQVFIKKRQGMVQQDCTDEGWPFLYQTTSR